MTAAPLRVLLAVFVVVCGLWDLRVRRIPNWLTVGAFALALVLQIYLFRLEGLKSAMAGFGVALLITLPLFMIRGLGGGDVKMMAATGAMTGYHAFVVIFILNAIVGGVVALLFALFKGRLGGTLANVGRILGSLSKAKAPHEEHPQIDIESKEALTIPRGAIYAACVLLMLAFGQS